MDQMNHVRVCPKELWYYMIVIRTKRIKNDYHKKRLFLLDVFRCHKPTYSVFSNRVFFTTTFIKSFFLCLCRCRILNNWKTTTLRLQVNRCLKTISKTNDVSAPAGGEERNRDKMSDCSIFVQFFHQYLMAKLLLMSLLPSLLALFFSNDLKQLTLLMKASLFANFNKSCMSDIG